MNKILVSGVIGAIAVIAIVAAVFLQEPTQDTTQLNEINPENIVEPESPENIVEHESPEIIEPKNPEIVGPPTESEKELEFADLEQILQEYGEDYSSRERNWQTSGPFQIDRSQYLLGENIFLRIGGLQQTEKGQVAFLRPLNDTHYSVYMTIPFDGSEKFTFNQYFKPDLVQGKGVCDKGDLIGRWAVVFQGTSYDNLYFEIVDAYLSGEKSNYLEKVC